MTKQKQLKLKNPVNVDYDTAWKDLVEELFSQFLEYFFPDIYQDIDFSKKCEFLSNELRKIVKDNHTGKRYADVLVKVQLKDGTVRCIFIHVEIQGSPETNFAERMFVYNYRIYDRHRKFNEEVISLAVLTDEDESFRPDEYRVKRWGFEHKMKFPIVKITDFKNKITELEQSSHPMALVILSQLKSFEAKKADADTKYDVKLNLFKECLKRGYNKDQIRILIKFIDWIINLPEKYQKQLNHELLKLEEERIMGYVTSWERFAKEEGLKIGERKGLEIGERKGLEIGERKGLEIGEKKGEEKGIKSQAIATAQRMLKDNFPLDKIAKYTDLPLSEIQRLSQG